MAFIDRFMEALEIKQISQYKLCKDLEIGQSTISSWKKGKMPTVDKIIAIVRYLEVSADWILETEEKESLSLEEKQILEAYRNAEPAIQKATRKLLDAPEPAQEELSTSRTG
jgi:transcriptional regulator with XRE-family HTH domain